MFGIRLGQVLHARLSIHICIKFGAYGAFLEDPSSGALNANYIF